MKKFRVQARAPAEFAPWETTWDGEQFYPATDAYDREMAKNCSIIRVRIQERIYWRWTTLWEGYGTKRERAPERYTPLPVYKWAVYDEWCRKEPQVKIEKIQTSAAYYRIEAKYITPPVTGSYGLFSVDVSESEAREIYDGLGKHFGGQHNGDVCYYATLDNKQRRVIAEKDAEIARLKERLTVHEAGKSCIWHPEMLKLQAEVERLKEQKKYNADQVVELSNEVSRLRGWLLRLRYWTTPNYWVRGECDRALAGEPVPE
jgi:hypothetical protein